MSALSINSNHASAVFVWCLANITWPSPAMSTQLAELSRYPGPSVALIKSITQDLASPAAYVVYGTLTTFAGPINRNKELATESVMLA